MFFIRFSSKKNIWPGNQHSQTVVSDWGVAERSLMIASEWYSWSVLGSACLLTFEE